MNVVGKFLKVSEEQYVKDVVKTLHVTEQDAKKMYANIVLPKRATKGSAGYDIYTPIAFTLKPQETITIPTGIRIQMKNDWVFCIFPRSGFGFKFRLQLNNTVGIIDSDYFYSDNEGHLFVKVTNDSYENKILEVEENKGFAQGIFFQYGVVEDDDVTEIRNGGFGSTDGR